MATMHTTNVVAQGGQGGTILLLVIVIVVVVVVERQRGRRGKLLNPPADFRDWHLEAAQVIASALADFIALRQ